MINIKSKNLYFFHHVRDFDHLTRGAPNFWSRAFVYFIFFFGSISSVTLRREKPLLVEPEDIKVAHKHPNSMIRCLG